MLAETLLFFVENFIFWGFVYLIVFMGCETPAIVFTGFGFFLFYWLFKFVFQQKGVNQVIWMYVANMIITVMLLYYFLTGASIPKAFRSGLNSLARRFPDVEPYVKRC